MKGKFIRVLFLTGVIACFSVRPVFGLFTDEEIGLEASAQTAVLDLEFSEPGPVTGTINPLDPFSQPLTVFNLGNTETEYFPAIDSLNGDPVFCEALWLRVERGGTVVFSGYLSDFDASAFLMPVGEDQDWEFFFSFEDTDPALENKACSFDLIFNGYQPGGNPGEGFFDEEVLAFEISSGSWVNQYEPRVVITEVYYDVDSPEKGSDGGANPDEWIELYNQSETSVNLKNWTLSDNYDTATIHANVTLPAHGFAVLAKSANTWTYWNIPAEAVTIELGTGPLSNTGDRVVLSDDEGNEVDAVSWGTDTYAFDPPVPDVSEGHSISRADKETDTNSAADWMDTWSGSSPPGPNPGTNPHPFIVTQLEFFLEEGEESVGFRATGLDPAYFDTINYRVTYDSDLGQQGVMGEATVTETEFEKRQILLGVCSAGGECILHTGFAKVELEVVLEGVITRTLHAELIL